MGKEKVLSLKYIDKTIIEEGRPLRSWKEAGVSHSICFKFVTLTSANAQKGVPKKGKKEKEKKVIMRKGPDALLAPFGAIGKGVGQRERLPLKRKRGQS